MLHRSDGEVQRAAKQMRELGADWVRITAGWSALAPAPRDVDKPGEPFNARDTRTYPQAGLAALDRAVRVATNRGLKVQIDLAFWAPRWAVQRRGENPERERFGPNAEEFAKFAEAIARRYSGRFTDPKHGVVRPLPRVGLWTTWNEPNKWTFLAPQWVRTGKRVKGAPKRYRPMSPHIYRPMHQQAYDVIKALDPSAVVLIGGLNSRGNPKGGRRGVPPLTFLRTMACLDAGYQPLRVPQCDGGERLRADGLALHPYSLHAPPNASAKEPDNVFLADLGRVDAVLSELVARDKIDGHWPLYITEYGYETSPPDPTTRHSLGDQARYMAWATYIAHSYPNVKMFAQFLLRDTPVTEPEPGRDRRRNNFQTGLLFADGQPKPGASGFTLPLFGSLDTTATGEQALVLYGGARPGDGPQVVRVERRIGPDQWAPVQTFGGVSCGATDRDFVTDRSGFFRRIAPWEGPGAYRLVWQRSATVLEHGPPVWVGLKPLLD